MSSVAALLGSELLQSVFSFSWVLVFQKLNAFSQKIKFLLVGYRGVRYILGTIILCEIGPESRIKGQALKEAGLANLPAVNTSATTKTTFIYCVLEDNYSKNLMAPSGTDGSLEASMDSLR